uniref:uncharacterized protein LOC120335120 n=1 Tax=Styela clava TaxID=7725 RepID=UPI00193A0EC1|nr:uncharacterized protein LOC120335120 [Styela clava]
MTSDPFTPYSSSGDGICRNTVVLNDGNDGVTNDNDLETPRNWEFWEHYYLTMGLSCSQDPSEPGTEDPHSPSNPDTGGDKICEAGVWSDAGVDMSNDVAGALLITFICLTTVLLFMFIFSCWQSNKMKKKIKKLLSDDYDGSVVSNMSSKL